jgi:hypothetical protein
MTQLFHREVGIPEALHHTLPYPCLRYTRHALDAARDDYLTSLPRVLPEKFEVVEIECLNGVASKWTLCIHYPHYDLFLVVLRDGLVKTVWTSEKDETRNLQWERYARPDEHSTRRVEP